LTVDTGLPQWNGGSLGFSMVVLSGAQAVEERGPQSVLAHSRPEHVKNTTELRKMQVSLPLGH